MELNNPRINRRFFRPIEPVQRFSKWPVRALIVCPFAMAPPMREKRFAIGSPTSEELAFSVTGGIVSGLRETDGVKFLQTDTTPP